MKRLLASPPSKGESEISRFNELRKLLERKDADLDEDQKRYIDAVEGALQRHDFDKARLLLNGLGHAIDLSEIAYDLRGLWGATPPGIRTSTNSSTVFNVGSMNLFAWHEMLMPPEKEICLSGPTIEPGIHYLEQGLPLKASHASSVDFQPDSESIYTVLKRFQGFGYGLKAFIHSHPGRGANVTQPSGRDRETQASLEEHYRCIGLVVSEDGYLRAFSHCLAFELRIFGQNVEVIDAEAHLYRILLP